MLYSEIFYYEKRNMESDIYPIRQHLFPFLWSHPSVFHHQSLSGCAAQPLNFFQGYVMKLNHMHTTCASSHKYRNTLTIYSYNIPFSAVHVNVTYRSGESRYYSRHLIPIPVQYMPRNKTCKSENTMPPQEHRKPQFLLLIE